MFQRQMRSIGMFNAVSVMVGSGEQLVRAMGVIKDFFFLRKNIYYSGDQRCLPRAHADRH